MFWLVALLLVAAALLMTLGPLLRGASSYKVAGLGLLLVIPLAVYFLYQDVGTPQALDAQAVVQQQALDTGLDELVETLAGRLRESAEDVEGWVLLGRSYKTLQRFPEALAALQTADRLVPNDPIILVELVEAQLFASGQPLIDGQMQATLQRALEGNPELQKAYWLLGIAAVQMGDDAAAIDWWRQLQQRLEPGSPVAQSVSQQIAEAQARMGVDFPDPPPADTVSTVLGVRVKLGEEMASADWPDSAALFVIAHDAASPQGPPLAAQRLSLSELPLTVQLSDADSMMAQRPLSGAQQWSVRARLSLTGQALPSSGDWQSAATVVSSGSSDVVELIIDQQVP